MAGSTNKMLKAFWNQAEEMLSRVPLGQVGAPVTFDNIGAEMELVLWESDSGKLGPEKVKREVVTEMGHDVGFELGACCVELHPGPVSIASGGLKIWVEQLDQIERRLWEVAGKHGLSVAHWGAIPHVSTIQIERTDEQKYKLVPDYHNTHRPKWYSPSIGGIDISDAGVVGLLNSFQFTVQTKGVEEALCVLNWMFAVSPVAVALSANAHILGNTDVGWADCRFEVWRRSHETRSFWERLSGRVPRVGLPRGYFKDIRSYLRDVASYPFILNKPEAALAIGIGLYWRDARIKFAECDGSVLPLVEFRPMSMQNNVRECVCMAAFVLGRIFWAINKNEKLPAFKEIRRHKYRAEKFGPRGFSVKYLLEEVEKSLVGLKLMGLEEDCESLDIRTFLHERCR